MFSRVDTIHRMIEWTTGREYLPLYHVDGELNLSDPLTKKCDITIENLSIGHPWMRLETVDTLYQLLKT